MVAILREDHPLCKKDSITISDLENEPIILCKGGYEPPIIDMFKQANVPLRAEYVISTVTTALNMIQEGLGIAILAELSLTNLPKNANERIGTTSMERNCFSCSFIKGFFNRCAAIY